MHISKGTRIKNSFYNFFIKQDDGTIIVYNSITGVIIRIYESDNIAKLDKIMNGDIHEYDDCDDMIKVFYEKGILVLEDKDEYNYVRYAYERDFIRDRCLRMTLITTRQCNLRCIYCYEEHENKRMTEEVYSALLNYISSALERNLCDSVAIGLFGGEPFVEFKNVIDFLGKAKTVCEEHRIPFSANATTNGTLITPERFNLLSDAGMFYYQISIDGIQETHDKYRPNANGTGSWQTIINNLRYMKSTDRKFRVTLRTNFNDEVFAHAEEWYQFIKDNFDDPRFSIYYEGIKKLGGENDAHLDILDKSAVTRSQIDIAQKIKELGMRNDLVDTFTLPYAKVCYASRHNEFVLDYDGSLLKCTLSLDDNLNRVGYLEADGNLVIDQDKHAKWVGCKIELPAYCKLCKVLPICFGGRCINGRVHGQPYNCDAAAEEQEIANLISKYC